MPRLPDIESLGARPTPQVARPVASMSPASLAGGVDEIAKAVEVQSREQDAAAVFEAKRRLDDWEREAIYGEKGAASRLGRDALDLPKIIPQQFDDFAKTLGTDMNSPRARQALAEVVTSRRAQIGDWAARHAAQQRKVYEQGQVEADVQSSVDRAVRLADADDMPNALAEVKVGEARMIGYLRSQGRSEEEIGGAVREVKGKAMSGILMGLIDRGRVDDARKFLTTNEGALPLETRGRAVRALELAEFDGKAQKSAEALAAKFGGDVRAALQEARATLDGKLEDAVVTRLKTMDAERVQLRERDQRDAEDQAWQIYERTGSMRGIPATVLERMDGRALSSLRRTARAEAEAAAGRREVKTDPQVYYALSVMAVQDPEAFKRQDLRGFFDKLSPSDRKHFIDRQATAISKPDAYAEVSTLEQQKSAIVKALKLDKDDAGLFYQVADRTISARQQELKRALTQDERQKELDRLVLQGTTPGRLWDSSTRQFKAIAEGREFTPKWDESQRRQAVQALQRRGVANPSDTQIDAVLKQVYGMGGR